MGKLVINTRGSFPNNKIHEESAMLGGHAAAIGRGIEYLASLLPAAIELDHQLHEDGQTPPEAPFGHRSKN